jgi:NTP pyrophosphatase (non-canonical NTP hydrolase)
MKFLWKRFTKWVREWVTLPARWREYKEYLGAWEADREQLRGLMLDMGYLGENYMAGAVKMARRCIGAEVALKRLAAAAERELEAAPLPKLTAAEVERLAMLAEECGEVEQAVGKILRHGWESCSPYGSKTNRAALEREIGDVRAVVGLMLDARDVHLGDLQHWQRRKRAALATWTHHQADSMPREEQLAMIRVIELERRPH